jgi:hypothetical protein
MNQEVQRFGLAVLTYPAEKQLLNSAPPNGRLLRRYSVRSHVHRGTWAEIYAQSYLYNWAAPGPFRMWQESVMHEVLFICCFDCEERFLQIETMKTCSSD